MFSFIDAASEHAHALSHFHSYALFFLILVIVFVIWVLKMTLKFFVVERDLQGALIFSNSYIFDFNFFVPKTVFFFWINLLTAGSSNTVSTFLADLYFAVISFFNVTKTLYSYNVLKTMYPDQGKKINIFSVFPRLVNVSHRYKSVFPAGHVFYFNFIRNTRPISLNSIFDVYHTLLHDVPFLFPFERIDIPVFGPYSSVEEFLNIQLLTTSYVTLLKHAAWKNVFKANNASNTWIYWTVSPKIFLGYGVKLQYFFFKKYSRAYTPFFTFTKFYGSEMRMFFYLFFQHVRHRKVLEWVWTCVPALILIFLLYPSLLLLYCYDRPYITKPYLTFKAIGHQWYWSYEYSDFVTSLAELGEHIKFDSYMIHQDELAFGEFRLLEVDRRVILPIGICIRLITTSSDVLHSWAVPALGVKIDAVPGRLNQFWIVTDRPGTFYGQCSELCGVNHGFMPIAVECAVFTTFFKALSVAATI